MNNNNNNQDQFNHTNQANQNQPNQAYQAYYERKRIAMIMEENNNSKLIVIPSVAKKGAPNEWLKIGGNSAYFYKYLIAPRLHKKTPTLHPDTDLNYRFKSGVIAIHWRDSFVKNLASLKLTPVEESGLLIFNLNHTFSSTEIKKLYAKENEAREKTNQILKPTHSIPELYNHLLTLAEILPNKIRKMNEFYRNYYGEPLNNSLIKLFELYIEIVSANPSSNNLSSNNPPQSTIKNQLIIALNKINAILIILNENHALDYSTEQRLGILLLDIKNSISRNFKS